jgi:hypothetical protein
VSSEKSAITIFIADCVIPKPHKKARALFNKVVPKAYAASHWISIWLTRQYQKRCTFENNFQG